MEQCKIEDKFVDFIIDEYSSSYARLDDRGALTDNGLVQFTVGDLSPFASRHNTHRKNLSLVRQKIADVALVSTLMLSSVAASNIIHISTIVHQGLTSFRSR